MDKKRIVASAVVFVILAALVYLQYRHWQTFDWGTFWAQTGRIKKIHVLHAIALIYIGYVLRALRWKIFLKPVRPQVKVVDLVSPTLIGFTGLALLGRAGEFIRPYLIARRTDLAFLLAVGSVGRGTHLRRWGIHGADGAGDFSAQRTACDSPS
jgi:glycosyltransferase 2 family protein